MTLKLCLGYMENDRRGSGWKWPHHSVLAALHVSTQGMGAKAWSTVVWILANFLVVSSGQEKMGVPSETLPQGYLSPAPLFPWEAILRPFLIASKVLKRYLYLVQDIATDCETKELQVRIDSQWVFPQLAVQPFGAFCFSIIPFAMWIMNITTFHYFFHCIYHVINYLSLIMIVSLLVALSDLALALVTVVSPSQDHDHLSSNRSDCNDIISCKTERHSIFKRSLFSDNSWK